MEAAAWPVNHRRGRPPAVVLFFPSGAAPEVAAQLRSLGVHVLVGPGGCFSLLHAMTTRIGVASVRSVLTDPKTTRTEQHAGVDRGPLQAGDIPFLKGRCSIYLAGVRGHRGDQVTCSDGQ